jgi:hypothetical protein
MPREVTDAEGIVWTCAQAYAGLSNDAEHRDAARAGSDRYRVVCTPSGGARSVRLELPGDWEQGRSDEELLRDIESQRDVAG